MIVGFTGTRNGMTPEQRLFLSTFLISNRIEATEAHHGDCVGADADFHQLCMGASIPVVIHPPEFRPNDSLRAYCEGYRTLLLPKGYLARNRDIVNASEVIFACPRLMVQEDRGGTWYTINFATKKQKTVYIFWPDGSYEIRNNQNH